jgi:hypothetical protein
MYCRSMYKIVQGGIGESQKRGSSATAETQQSAILGFLCGRMAKPFFESTNSPSESLD